MLDLRLAIRALRASPIVSSVAALSLSLGIGANTAVFSLVNGLLLRTLPVEAPGRLVTISTDSAIKIGFNAGIGWSSAMFEALREREQAFDGVAAWTVQPLDLAPSGERQPVQALIALGAAPGQVVRLILSRVATLVGVGIAAGAGLSVWASAFAASLLYGLTPRDPVSIIGAALTLAAVAAFAGGLPAARAARVDPMTALRE